MSKEGNLKFDTRPFLALLTGLLLAAGPLRAQDQAIAPQTASIAQSAVVPQTIRFNGTAPNRAGDTVEAVFRIYATPEGGEALWSETQRVAIVPDGRYTVLLGSASVSGLPQTVFAAGQARWLGVSIERDEEQPRTPLASVAYAMKAADAETLAGRAVAEFVTQEQLSATAKALSARATALALPEAAPTGSGTADYLPLWTSSSALGDSILFQEGKTKIGIATKTPAATLDVNGDTTLRGTVSLAPAGPATADSQMLELIASVSAVAQNFAWRAVAKPSANLELLFGSGSAALAATGLAISPKGIVTFAKDQAFPGTGPGTITGVTAGTALTGGGKTGSVTLNVDTTKVALLAAANTFAGSNTFSSPITFAAGQPFPGAITGVAAGTAMTGGGTTGSVTLNVDINKVVTAVNAGAGLTGGGTGGAQTLTVDPTKVPLLAAANTFAGTNKFSTPITFATGQTFPGSGTITGVSAGTALTGGGTGGPVTLSVDTTKVLTAVTAGTGLTGGGTGGAQTLSVDATKVPLLGSANTYAGSQNFSGQVTAQSLTVTGNQTIKGSESIGGSSGYTAQLNVVMPGTAAAIVGVSAAGRNGVYGEADGEYGNGVAGYADGADGWAVSAYATDGGYGGSPNGVGVWAASAYYGIVAQGNCCSGGIGTYDITTQDEPGAVGAGGGVGVMAQGLFGVQGFGEGGILSTPSWGVFGGVESASALYSSQGASFAGTSSAGVWGDDTNSTGAGSGVLATADSDTALMAVNNSANPTMEVTNNTKATHDPVFETYSPNAGYSPARNCVIDTSANLECSGLVEGQVTPDVDGTVRAMYAMQSPEIWFEDFGSATLQNGSAHVSLEPVFGGTVNSAVEYHVFLTPKGECEGLYIANEGPDGFDVRELRHGKSSVAFDYRIVAKRKGYETVRMEDQTAQAEARKAREEGLARRLAEAAAIPSAPQARKPLHPRPPARPALIPQRLTLPASRANSEAPPL
jgi:hypothetical protein